VTCQVKVVAEEAHGRHAQKKLPRPMSKKTRTGDTQFVTTKTPVDGRGDQHSATIRWKKPAGEMGKDTIPKEAVESHA